MSANYISDQEYNHLNFAESSLNIGEYENCVFRSCNFEYADFSAFNFNDCEFIDCNLNMAKVMATAFREVFFKDSKILGVDFSSCNDFGFSVRFENCQLTNSVFYKSSLKKTVFKDCILRDVDFSEADLRSAVFSNSDLSGAFFDRTHLEQTDFRTAFGFAFNPDNNKMKGAKFSASNVSGLLHHHKIVIDKST